MKRIGYKVLCKDKNTGKLISKRFFMKKNLQYVIDGVYTQSGSIKINSNGFHYCKNIEDLLLFYTYNSDNVICKIIDKGNCRDINDKVIATNKIKILGIVPEDDLPFELDKYGNIKRYEKEGNKYEFLYHYNGINIKNIICTKNGKFEYEKRYNKKGDIIYYCNNYYNIKKKYKWNYDNNGKYSTIIDRGFCLKHYYNKFGKLFLSTLHNGDFYMRVYNENGDVIREGGLNKHLIEYEYKYDKLGRKVKEINTIPEIWVWRYNKKGDLCYLKDNRGYEFKKIR